ncbi:MAG: glycosyltransferase family A protein [Candidatus Omnitrophota bacterium]|jgi:GT2 family glycosyltransferase
MDKKLPFASVVICTKNRKECLEKYSLPSVLNLDYPDYEVVIVCDESMDGTESLLRDYNAGSGRLRVVKNLKSRGIAYARNLCVYYAKGEIIAFTDDDCLINADWLERFVDEFNKNEELMALGGLTYDGYSNKVLSAEGIYGFNMAFRKKVFDKFLFDTNLFFHKGPMHEETDLVSRMKRHGYLAGYAPGAIARHYAAPASYRWINKRIGDHLNAIYMDAKKFTLACYYYRFFKRSNEMFRKIKKLHHEGILSFHRSLLKIGWVNYVLLFELPWKAKITQMREKKIFRKGNGANKMRELFSADCFFLKGY